ncbi:hypothetical protein [Corallococcus sp. M7]
MGSSARSITTALVLGSLMGCATAPSMNTDLEKGPLGSRTQMKTPLDADSGPRVEELENPSTRPFDPTRYLRIHGRGKTRRLVTDETGRRPLCRRISDNAPEGCPELDGLAWLDLLSARLSAQNIRPGAWPAPAVKARKDGREPWTFCVSLLDWQYVDATIAAIDALLIEQDITTDVCIVLHGVEDWEHW